MSNSNKKFLLIFPPSWLTVEPHLACPSLVSQLKKNGFEAKVWDLNIDFANHIFTSDYVLKSFYMSKDNFYKLNSIKNTFLGNYSTYENKVLNIKYEKYLSFFENNKEEKVKLFINAVDEAVNVYKNPKLFYNPKNIIRAFYIMKKAAEIISLPYSPLTVNMFSSDVLADVMPLNYEDIKKIVFDTSVNIYNSFFEEQVKKIQEEKYSFIGISIASKSQLIAGLTLANILKQKTNSHINIGGTFFSFVKENLKNHSEFFELFADSVSFGEGELSIVELARYVNEEIPISQVPGLIYKNEDNNVIYNKESVPCILSHIAIPDFTDYDFKKYFSPYPVIPIQTQRGCYWRKCSFCAMSHGKTYTVKKMDDLIEEIKVYKEKYNVYHFDIIDGAIVPFYLDKFFDKIIENRLNIKLHFSLRLEKEIDYKFLKKAYKAGTRYIQWGVETGNKRIHDLINKGVDFQNRLKILKLTNKAGILNCAFTLYAFPSETFKESLKTYDFIFKNSKLIQAASASQFYLSRYSIISRNPEKFGVIIDENQPDFEYSLSYTQKSGMNDDERKKYAQMFYDALIKTYQNTIFYYINDYTLLFLYNCKYDLNYLKKIKVKRNKL